MVVSPPLIQAQMFEGSDP